MSWAQQMEVEMGSPAKVPPPRTLRKFGLTSEQYAELYGDGHCPICLKAYGSSRLAAIDHDHRTFEVRGVICAHCNFWLGTVHDDWGRLRRAADYLQMPPTSLWTPIPRVADAPPRQED